jgi:hypothetical protein
VKHFKILLTFIFFSLYSGATTAGATTAGATTAGATTAGATTAGDCTKLCFILVNFRIGFRMG